MKNPLLLLPFLLAIGLTIRAADVVITNPVRVTGANAISPDDAALETSFNATGSTAVGTLTGLDTFGAVQDFSGFTGTISTGNDYIFSFSDPLISDVRFRYTGSVPNSESVALANNGFSTSTDSAMRLNTLSTAGTFGMRIDFGSYDGVSGIFTTGTEIEAAAFTLAGRFERTDSGVTIEYLDSANNVLSSQVLDNQVYTETTIAGYTGFQAPGSNLSGIEISYTGDSGPTILPIIGLDDFGYTAIPEPSTLVLVGLAGLGLIAGLRRHRRD